MNWLLELLFPPRARCAICGELSEQRICTVCRQAIADFQKGANGQHARRLGRHKVIALLPYDGRLRRNIHRLKFANRPAIARELALAFATASLLPISGVDLVTAVPMHRSRFLQRGYNQAELLAKELASLQQLPFRHVLKRTRATPPQNTLGRALRQTNVAGAFVAYGDLAGRRILLVDDVLTTGSTLEACVRALYTAKVGEVTIAVAAISLAPQRGTQL